MNRRAGMMTAWRAIARFVTDVRFLGVNLIYFNLLWFFLSLPIITLPSATGALYVITREMMYRKNVGWRDFLQAMRHWFAISWRWGLLNLIAALLFIVNFWFYASLTHPLNLLTAALLLGVLFVWLLVQMYTFPVMLEQEQPHLRLALRNAFALCVRYPLFTLTYAIVAGLFVFMSLVVPYFWMIFTAAVIFYLYNHAVFILLRIERGERPFDDEDNE